MRKLGLIWNVLRGRPVMYRMVLHIDNTPFMWADDTENYHAIVVENTFLGPNYTGHTHDWGTDRYVEPVGLPPTNPPSDERGSR